MSQRIVDRLKQHFGTRILDATAFRGDDTVLVAPADWFEVATFLRDDAECAMKQFVDLTAVDYPEREPELARFDVVLSLRSFPRGDRLRVKTRVADGAPLASLVPIWRGANWTEREVWDMFGIRFEGHPDLRRILMYEEFEGFPLRKDYPIDRAQPLVPYRDVATTTKLAPFGMDEGQPFARVDWRARLGGADLQVSPAIAVQSGQRANISESTSKLGREGEE